VTPEALELKRPCTPCTHLGVGGWKFKLQTGEVLTVAYGDSEVPAAVGVLHKADGSFYVCEHHRNAPEQAQGGRYEAMEDFEARVLAADAVQRLTGE
jgi:hypothetical protein